MASILKRNAIKCLTIGRKYLSTVYKPFTSEIPMDRVFEVTSRGTRFVLTNDYSVAKNGANERNEIVVYYPEKFQFSIHKRYEQMITSGIELIEKFEFAMPGTKRFRDLVNIRSDLMAAFTLVTDAPNTDNREFVRAYHDHLLTIFIHDDFMVKILPQKFANIEKKFVDNLKIAQRLEIEPKLFAKNDSQLCCEEKEMIDEANKIILAHNDVCKRFREHCSAKVYHNFCVAINLYFDYSVIENNLLRQNRPITWNEFINIFNYQTATHSSVAFNDHNDPCISLFDPFITLGILYTRLWNDVLSYDKELNKELEEARVNSVTVLKSMHPNMTEEQAMAKVMSMASKILHDMEQHVEYLRDEEKQVYIKFFKHFVGFSEAQILSLRLKVKRVSGTPTVYESFEHNGIKYGYHE